MKVEIVKIRVQLKDREIELSADEARKVRAELDKLFAEEDETALRDMQKRLEDLEKRPTYVPYVPYIQHPIYIDRYTPWWSDNWRIMCDTADTNNNNTTMDSCPCGGYQNDAPIGSAAVLCVNLS